MERSGWQLIDYELMRGEMHPLVWAGSGCSENSHDLWTAADVWVLHKTKMICCTWVLMVIRTATDTSS
jgi:hypothetical protein